MDLSISTLLWLALIVWCAALAQGFTGFGFGVLGVSLSALLVGARTANLVWTILATVLVLVMTMRLRRKVNWRLVAWLFAGAVVSMWMGVWVLAVADDVLLGRILGATVLAFALFFLLNPRFKVRQLHCAWGVLPGLVSGFFSGATAAGGPAVVVFFLILGLEKDTMKATLAGYFLMIGVYKLLVLTLGKGLLRLAHLEAAAPLCLALVAGMALGMYGARYVSSPVMRRIICLFLFVPSLILLLR